MKYILLYFMVFTITFTCLSQEPNTAELTREEILEMSIDDLADLSLEELMDAMEIVGVSSMEELIELLINRNVYSASRREEGAFGSPLSSSVLTKEELRDYGATTIEEALRLVPGVIVREKTNGNFDVHLRGLDNLPQNHMLLYSENTNTLLMINGRPVFNYAHGAIVWESLPIGFEDIERIEVVRGPSSALYGPNAVNGVINIITGIANSDSPLVSGTLRGGTQDTYTGDIAVRRVWSDNLSSAVTTNFQHRGRDREEVYMFDAGNMVLTDGNGTIIEDNLSEGFYSIDEYDRLYNQTPIGLQPVKRPEYEADELFSSPDIARENIGVNVYTQYLSGDNSYDLSFGYQNSSVLTTPAGDTPSSFSGRESSTAYVDFTGSIGRVNIQTNYLFGTQDFAAGETGFEVDMGQFNSSLDYDFHIGELNLRPGVSYQSVYYDDSPNLASGELGYLNEKKKLNTFATSLRIDYLAFNQLRLVAALRAEKYNYPDEWYPSWQFAGTLPLGDNHLIRAVYSRANRSSFIVNSHSDYLWNREGRMPPSFIHFAGSEEYDLMTSDMIEIGYRFRPFNNVVLETELFGSKSENYGALLAESSAITFPVASDKVTYEYVAKFMDPALAPMPSTRANIAYQNLNLEATQIGATINLDWIITDKLIAKMHATLQQTKLDNVMTLTNNDIIDEQFNEAEMLFEELVGGILQHQIDLPLSSEMYNYATSYYFPEEDEDGVKNRSTPLFWGMAGLLYKPTDKLNLSGYGYYYGEQTFENQNGTFVIDPKFILNLQADYEVSKGFNLFLNARNILNDKSREFAFMDEIGAIYMGGVRFAF
ncbi:TonB-dependent receptor [Marinilabiliaceae bacterium ANBcel2]|nr:TonB-dependent receptor [Marinilabiliaceae bacterium ANBcel2]